MPDDDAGLHSPVEDPDDRPVEDGVALCLSGGGFRAMLFHAGALWRLNELAYLPRLARVSSVSGGSITAATLAMRWGDLRFGADGVAAGLQDALIEPVRALAGRTIDEVSIARGLLTPGTVAEKVAREYRRHAFGDATLQDLPDEPRFVINATNLQTGALWRFSKPYMADHTIGLVRAPRVTLADAVAASSAFPPVLSPMRLDVDPASWAPEGRGPLHEEPYTSEVVLSDGGVYDNLGLETAWKRFRTVLVGDGGGRMGPEPEVHTDWARHAIRVGAIVDNQVRSLRKRQTIAGFRRGDRLGAYWGIRSDAGHFGPVPGALPCPPELTRVLADTKTRLKELDATRQERLINWGYAVCDVAMRRWVEPDADPPEGFPYAGAGVG